MRQRAIKVGIEGAEVPRHEHAVGACRPKRARKPAVLIGQLRFIRDHKLPRIARIAVTVDVDPQRKNQSRCVGLRCIRSFA